MNMPDDWISHLASASALSMAFNRSITLCFIVSCSTLAAVWLMRWEYLVIRPRLWLRVVLFLRWFYWVHARLTCWSSRCAWGFSIYFWKSCYSSVPCSPSPFRLAVLRQYHHMLRWLPLVSFLILCDYIICVCNGGVRFTSDTCRNLRHLWARFHKFFDSRSGTASVWKNLSM